MTWPLLRFCVFLLLLPASGAAVAQDDAGSECRFWSKPYARTFPLRGGYRLKMTHIEPAKQIGCHVDVLSPRGESLFTDEEWDISLDQKDLNLTGDGRPSLVLRGYSGGAHCCWNYWILTPSRRPVLQKKIENQAHVQFADFNRNGLITLVAQDGSFDYFDGLCHACTVFPDLYLRMQGDKIVDVSSEYRSRYDDEIKAARMKLIHEPLQNFMAARYQDQMAVAGENVKPLVLTIVLAYLYSGREEQAWKALDEMWPPFDRQRIKKLIVETRGKGLLRYAAK
jgi:hypothetical protein